MSATVLGIDSPPSDLTVFETLESEVRTYSRTFPAVFTRATGAFVFDETGRDYLDFWCGAGAVNYGHSNPRLKAKILEYIQGDGITHSLDLATGAKREFLRRFQDIVLQPRGLDYRVQFTGPTGTNAIEAALKLARKVTKRTGVVFFTNAYHGVTLGALAVTANAGKRAAAGVPLCHSFPVPYFGDLGPGRDSLDDLEVLLRPGSGFDLPAAIIVETLQAEGGVRPAGFAWLARIGELARRHEILLIVDDIQVGCGRTGPFFSFEPAGLAPDIVCLSKSISGYGLPMAIVLIRPELDIWGPGEHNGTFRGNNLAFVAAAEALSYWQGNDFQATILAKAEIVRTGLEKIARQHTALGTEVRGRGLIQGIAFADPTLAAKISRAAFDRGLIVETAGPADEVVKLMPPLVIEDDLLHLGLERLEESVEAVVS